MFYDQKLLLHIQFNFIVCDTWVLGTYLLMYLTDTCELSLQDKDMPSTLKSIYQVPNKGTQKV